MQKKWRETKVKPNSERDPICRVTEISLETKQFEQTRIFYLDFELFIDATRFNGRLIIVY